MRIDWFLPALRKSQDETPAHRTWLTVFRAWMPVAWRSNHRTKQRGRIRKRLRWLGASWLYSPVRRLSQSVCFLAFLWLFFFVCWPYTAKPVVPQSQSDWELTQFDQESGELQLRTQEVPDWISGSNTYFLIDGVDDKTVGEFHLATRLAQEIYLRPKALNAELISNVLLASGDWVMADHPPHAWPSHYTDELNRKESLPVDFFLTIDPLVSLSTAIAARQWVWSLVWALGILAVCVLVPRGFCGYICPLGTLIDLFDWVIGRRIQRLRVPADGWWVHIKYYLLAGSLLCACGGVLVTGYVAAIPVVTRGFLFLGEPIQSGLLRGWHLVPPPSPAMWLSVFLFSGSAGAGPAAATILV